MKHNVSVKFSPRHSIGYKSCGYSHFYTYLRRDTYMLCCINGDHTLTEEEMAYISLMFDLHMMEDLYKSFKLFTILPK